MKDAIAPAQKSVYAFEVSGSGYGETLVQRIFATREAAEKYKKKQDPEGKWSCVVEYFVYEDGEA